MKGRYVFKLSGEEFTQRRVAAFPKAYGATPREFSDKTIDARKQLAALKRNLEQNGIEYTVNGGGIDEVVVEFRK